MAERSWRQDLGAVRHSSSSLLRAYYDGTYGGTQCATNAHMHIHSYLPIHGEHIRVIVAISSWVVGVFLQANQETEGGCT